MISGLGYTEDEAANLLGAVLGLSADFAKSDEFKALSEHDRGLRGVVVGCYWRFLWPLVECAADHGNLLSHFRVDPRTTTGYKTSSRTICPAMPQMSESISSR